MGILLDVIFLLIVAICIFVAVKKGFVRSLVEVVGYVLAFVMVFSFSGMVAEYIYSNFIEESLIVAIETAVLENSNNAIEQLPNYIRMFLPKEEFDINSVLSASSVNVSSISEAVGVTIEPIAMNIIKTIAAFIIFALVLILSKILAKVINSLFRGAVLGTANKFLGAIIGLVKGAVIGAVYSLVVYLTTVLPSVEALSFTTEALNNSVICKYLVTLIIGHI